MKREEAAFWLPKVEKYKPLPPCPWLLPPRGWWMLTFHLSVTNFTEDLLCGRHSAWDADVA